MYIGGVNCSVGLAYGMTQISYLGSEAAKFIFKSLKYAFKLVFNTRNITTPLKYLFGYILGKDLFAKK